MLHKALFLSATVLILSTAAASADGYPNLIGNWTSSTLLGGAYFGNADHLPDQKNPVFATDTKKWTLSIEKQEGAGLIGTWSSEVKTEKLVGVIRRDQVNLLLSDEDNQFEASLISQNEMELCAHDSDEYSIAGCVILKRQ